MAPLCSDCCHCRSERPNCSLTLYMALTQPEMIAISQEGVDLGSVGKISISCKAETTSGGRSWSYSPKVRLIELFWS